jgi:hypothetical protein
LHHRYGHAGGLKAQPPPGTKVRFTGKFLSSTGQYTLAPHVWRVIGPTPGMPNHVQVDEKYDDEYRKMMWGDLPENERPLYRSIALGNLQIVGAKPKAADYP